MQHHQVQRPVDATRTTAELRRSTLSHSYASEDRSHVQELQPATSNQPGNSQVFQSVLAACMDRTQNLFLNEEIVLVFWVLSAFPPSFLLLNCPPMSPRQIYQFRIQLLTETIIFSSLREFLVLSQQEDEEHVGPKHLRFQVEVPEQRHRDLQIVWGSLWACKWQLPVLVGSHSARCFIPSGNSELWPRLTQGQQWVTEVVVSWEARSRHQAAK